MGILNLMGMLFSLGAASIILLTLIYVEVQSSELNFDKERKVTFAGILAIATALFTVALQMYLDYSRNRRRLKESD